MIPLPVTPGRADAPYGNPREQFKHIEIQINTACDVATCHGCDRFSDVVSAPNMTLDQVRLFAQESIDLHWEWERIRILGGEPTIHPQFWDIIEVICGYRRSFPKCFIQVLTAGYGKLDRYRSDLLDRGIDPHIEAKTKGVTPAWFNNSRLVPADRDPNIGALEPCGIFGIRGCGIGLTRNGYFLDGAGASVAMVAGYDIGVMHLRDVTWEAMIEQSKTICRVCGHWNDPRPGVPPVTQLVSTTGEVTGAFWTKKLAEYATNRPVLKVYGEA